MRSPKRSVALLSIQSATGHIALGFQAGYYLTTGSNNIEIAAQGAGTESNTMRLGQYGVQTNTFIGGIRGATVPGGMTVIVDSLGHMGTTTSSARFKEAIQSMDKASEAILGLQPVTFRCKPELDPQGIPQFGLVAKDVAKVNPDLVARDDEGKPYTVRYEAVHAMLLNEFLKEHRKVEEQQATIAELKSELITIAATVKEQAAQIQVVSATLQASKSSPTLVANNR